MCSIKFDDYGRLVRRVDCLTPTEGRAALIGWQTRLTFPGTTILHQPSIEQLDDPIPIPTSTYSLYNVQHSEEKCPYQPG